MLSKLMFSSAYSLKNRNFNHYYSLAKANEFQPYHILKKLQEEKLRKLISHSYENVPYYKTLFQDIGIRPQNINSIEDLQRIPILTKDIIRTNQKEFCPNNLATQKYKETSTGGSTGEPLHYRISLDDEILGIAIKYANWGYAGYDLGDKVAIIAGSSLLPDPKTKISNFLWSHATNHRFFSSFDMNETRLAAIISDCNEFDPKFIRGYASSLYFLANYVIKNGIELKFRPHGIFSTAERLFDFQRETIKKAFKTEVFDQYGLNDGGASAFECKEHSGLHVDMIRAVLEVVDGNGLPVSPGEEGRIVVTGLHNYSMPFIRYDTGDRGILGEKTCKCGRNAPLLKKITGRQQEFLETPEGLFIHGEFFSHIFWEINGVKEFQIIQDKINEIIIYIVPETNFDTNQLKIISKYIQKKSNGWNVEYKIVNKIQKPASGKWKFVIRDIR
ncbi:phenylacetate--CoA ligase family protein [Methanofollis fontis]|nr:phenylacetate--CoA ligase family protein [Methanofollis fontis]